MKYTEEQLVQWKSDICPAQVLRSRIRLDKEGGQFVGLCPFHDEKTGSFKIYKKDGWWQCHCHGACGKTWNIFQVLQHTDKISFDDAVAKVLTESQWEAGREMVESVFAEPLSAEKKFVTYPLEKLAQLESALQSSPEAQEWLKKRSLSTDTASSLHWGFLQSVRAINPTHPWVDRGWISMPTLQGEIVTCLKYSIYRRKENGDWEIRDSAGSKYDDEPVQPERD